MELPGGDDMDAAQTGELSGESESTAPTKLFCGVLDQDPKSEEE